jgi:CDP-diacylglycerol--serine O-phosphatidyltransferase
VKLALAASLTLANALCGFAGIVILLTLGTSGIAAAAAITFAAWAFDVVDGTAARALGVQSAFGAMLDSLCDVVSFGVLPALLVVVAGRGALGPLAFVTAGIYLCSEIVRLTRFTTKAVADAGPSRLWYSGLPCSVGGMSIAAVLFWTPTPWPPIAIALVAALLMLTPLPYVHLVKLLARRRTWLWTLAIPLALCAVVDWRAVLAAAFVAYLLSGAVVGAARRSRVAAP